MGKEVEQIVCPYCGQAQDPAPRCSNCGGLFDALSITATEIELGPWFVRDDARPFLPGCSYQVLCKRVEAGRIKKDTIIRGPTTRQLWQKAGHTPCIAHLLGTCHACGATVNAKDTKCKSCSAVFSESTERQELGLRFRTAYAAATARLELDKQIAQAKAAEKRAKELAEQRKQQAKSAPARKPAQVEDLITEGWDWRAAPKQPAPEADGEDAQRESTAASVAIPPEPESTDGDDKRPQIAARTMVYDGAGENVRSVFMPATGTGLSAAAQAKRPAPLLRPAGWCWLITLGALFFLLFRFFIERMTIIALKDGDWSHALFIPLISAWFIYQQRDRLIRIPAKINPWGLPVFFAGLISYAFWLEPGRNDMLKGYSMIVSLFGLVLFLLGTNVMRILWLPIVYLVFAVKVSPAIWERIAAKLQLLASKGSTIVLQFFGSFMNMEASRRGTTIDLSYLDANGAWVSGQALNVAEACSGLRMLAAFMALGVLVAFMTPRARWQRAILVLLTVPIALLVNIGRVTVLGLLYPINQEMVGGAFHQYVGLLMLIPALLLYLLAGWILDRIYIYEEGPRTASPTGEDDESSEATPLAVTPMQKVSSVVRGALTGGLLCILMALGYALSIFTIRPDLASKDFTPALSLQLLIGVAVVLVFWGWVVRRMIMPEVQRPRIVGRTISLGLMAGVMLTSVLLLSGIVKATKMIVIKEPINLRHPLFQIPPKMGVWERQRDDPALSEAQLEELGTRAYISREYLDTSLPPGAPGRLIKLHIAYYTGTPDTVPHVPERCYVAGGLQAVDETEAQITLAGPRYRPTEGGYNVPSQLEPAGITLPSDAIHATLFTFADPHNPNVQANVLYFFSSNGKYLHTPELVRAYGFDPRDRYSYYCKIEVLLRDVTNPTAATRRASAFLSEVMPEIVACLPNWNDVKQGRWPQ